MGVLTQILWYGSARQASGRAIVSPSCLLLTADTGTSFASVIFLKKRKIRRWHPYFQWQSGLEVRKVTKESQLLMDVDCGLNAGLLF